MLLRDTIQKKLSLLEKQARIFGLILVALSVCPAASAAEMSFTGDLYPILEKRKLPRLP